MSTNTPSSMAPSGRSGNHDGRRGNRWRIAGWSAAAAILLLPLVAMQFSDEVNWSAGDFAFAAALLLGVGIPFELAVRKTGDAAYRAAVGVALAAGFLLVWANGAVGLIGDAANAANALVYAVPAVGVVGALLARFRPRGMAYAMAATALALAVVALVGSAGAPGGSPLEALVVAGAFGALWLASAGLFLKAALDAPGDGEA